MMSVGEVAPAGKSAAVDLRKSRLGRLAKPRAEPSQQQSAPGRPGRPRLSATLSLVETLTLVLLVAVMVLGVRLAQLQARADDGQRAQESLHASLPGLKPLLLSLREKPQLEAVEIEELASRLARLTIAETRAADLARDNAALRKQLAERVDLPAAQAAPEVTVVAAPIAKAVAEPTAAVAIAAVEMPAHQVGMHVGPAAPHEEPQSQPAAKAEAIPASPASPAFQGEGLKLAAPRPGQRAAGRQQRPRPDCTGASPAPRRASGVSPWCS